MRPTSTPAKNPSPAPCGRRPGSMPRLGSGTGFVSLSQKPANLSPETAYRYRVVAKNSAATVVGETFILHHPAARRRRAAARRPRLGDGLAGRQERRPGRPPRGDRRRRRAAGAPPTGSRSPTARRPPSAGGPGRPAGQPVPRQPHRRAAGRRQNITVPLFSGSYGTEPRGRPLPALLRRPRPRPAAERRALPRRRRQAARWPTRRWPGPAPRPATRTTTCATAPRRLRGAARCRGREHSAIGPADFDLAPRRRLAGPPPRRPLQLRGA